MLSQNESAEDDDIENFKDIVEETEHQKTITSLDKPDKVSEVGEGGDAIDSDSDISLDEGGSPTSGFEDGDSDEGDELLMGGGLNDLDKPRKMSDLNTCPSQASSIKSSLPGGYDPRHREPSYWYVLRFVSLVLVEFQDLFSPLFH